MGSPETNGFVVCEEFSRAGLKAFDCAFLL